MEPVTGSLLGLIVYHERLSGGAGWSAVEVAACAAAAWGIVRLAGSRLAIGGQPASGRSSGALPDEVTAAGQRAQAGPIAAGGADEP